MDEQARMYKYNFLPQRTSLIPPPNTRNMKKRLKLLSCKALSPRGPSCRCLSRAPTDNTISLERTWGRTFSPSAAIQHQMIDSNASLILAKIFTSLTVGKKRYLGHLSKMICLIIWVHHLELYSTCTSSMDPVFHPPDNPRKRSNIKNRQNRFFFLYRRFSQFLFDLSKSSSICTMTVLQG